MGQYKYNFISLCSTHQHNQFPISPLSMGSKRLCVWKSLKTSGHNIHSFITYANRNGKFQIGILIIYIQLLYLYILKRIWLHKEKNVHKFYLEEYILHNPHLRWQCQSGASDRHQLSEQAFHHCRPFKVIDWTNIYEIKLACLNFLSVN